MTGKKSTPSIVQKRGALHYHLSGVDLTQVDGLNTVTVQMILSESGVDISNWPIRKHSTSWLSLCPNDKISGAEILDTQTKKTTNRAAYAFRLATRSLCHS